MKRDELLFQLYGEDVWEARDESSKWFRWRLAGNRSSDETRVSVMLLLKRRRSSRRDEMVKMRTRVLPP
ncbi:unnamed protein product [Brassica rapa]|uniref:Uncharacterized protein n=1 Tax=Brassica campestris TaxID=3711 RepID=A0A3P6C1A4_BRACM|nr:unnamed protein product [Brassica rapa]VDD12043.1 unnamed protein product [Brassica rapa]